MFVNLATKTEMTEMLEMLLQNVSYHNVDCVDLKEFIDYILADICIKTMSELNYELLGYEFQIIDSVKLSMACDFEKQV